MNITPKPPQSSIDGTEMATISENKNKDPYEILTSLFENRKAASNAERLSQINKLPVLAASPRNYALMEKMLRMAINSKHGALVEAILKIAGDNFRPKISGTMLTSRPRMRSESYLNNGIQTNL